MSNDLLVGWALGLVTSLLTALLLFWLEGKREVRSEQRILRRENVRTALNWKSGDPMSMRGFDLQGVNLSGHNLSGADLEGANLESAGLWGTKLGGSNLRRASFRKADIRGVNFGNAILHAADFTGAVIREANFSHASLRSAKFNQAKEITGCTWEGAKIDETTDLPPSIRELITQGASAVVDVPKESDGTDAKT